MARWTSEQLKRATQKQKANSSGIVKGTTGAGKKLVTVTIYFEGNQEDHYVFEGSQLEAYWRKRAEEDAENLKI